MSEERKITGPYDSPFDAIESDGRAASLRVKSTLVHRLMDYIEERDLTQDEAGAAFDVDQSRVSHLVNGRVSKFTIDYLIDMCDAAGVSWDIDRDDVYTAV